MAAFSPHLTPPIPSIAMSTFKGGVSKTTTALNLGYYFASRKGKKVLLVDCDAQCNLTQVFLKQWEAQAEEQVVELVTRTVKTDARFVNIGEALHEVMYSQTVTPQTVEVLTCRYCNNLLLMPGSMEIVEFESTLTAFEQSKQPCGCNIPCALYHCIQATARANNVDLILIDTSPSMGALNMVIVMSSTYFIIPCQADLYSWKALQTARYKILNSRNGFHETSWITRMEALQSYTRFSKSPLPCRRPIFLGAIVAMFTIHNNEPAGAFARYITKIKTELADNFGPALASMGMACRPDLYALPAPAPFLGVVNPQEGTDHCATCADTLPDQEEGEVPDEEAGEEVSPYYLAEVPNFNRFAPMAQSHGVPVLCLLDHKKLIVDKEGTKSSTGAHLATAVEAIERYITPLAYAAEFIWHLHGLNVSGELFRAPKDESED